MHCYRKPTSGALPTPRLAEALSGQTPVLAEWLLPPVVSEYQPVPPMLAECRLQHNLLPECLLPPALAETRRYGPSYLSKAETHHLETWRGRTFYRRLRYRGRNLQPKQLLRCRTYSVRRTNLTWDIATRQKEACMVLTSSQWEIPTIIWTASDSERVRYLSACR